MVLPSIALYWNSTTKYQPVPPYTDPVPPSNNQYSKEYQLADLCSSILLHINTGPSLTRTACHFFDRRPEPAWYWKKRTRWAPFWSFPSWSCIIMNKIIIMITRYYLVGNFWLAIAKMTKNKKLWLSQINKLILISPSQALMFTY